MHHSNTKQKKRPAFLMLYGSISVDSFKRVLDRWLTLVPDEPQIPNYTQCRRAPLNSILEMSKLEPNSESLTSIELGTPKNE